MFDLLDDLLRDDVDRRDAAGLGRVIQALEAELLRTTGGAATSPRWRSTHRPDVILERGPETPLVGLELKVIQRPQGLRSRFSGMIGQSVALRRDLPGVQLGLLLLVVDGPYEPFLLRESANEGEFGRLHRTPRGEAGFDRVVVGALSGRIYYALEGAGWRPLPDYATAIKHLTETGPSTQSWSHEAEERDDVAVPHDASPRRILLVASEWKSKHGGISSLNRQLARALVASGCEVHVFVPTADAEDLADADADNVTILQPVPVPGISGLELLLTRPSLPNYEPQVIVGHGRILGPYAYALRHNHYPNAVRLHIVHTSVDELEIAKEGLDGSSRMSVAGERREVEYQLARTAHVVLAVGPKLARVVTHELYPDHAKVLELRPGLIQPVIGSPPADVASPPPVAQVLILGRMEDYEVKGLELAVRAVAKAGERLSADVALRPKLVVRGLPDDNEATRLKQRIVEMELNSQHFSYEFHGYSVDHVALQRDLRRSRVVIMPSREEGFGLVAYEAIAAGVPVLVSQESGLAELLQELAVETPLGRPREVLSVRKPESVDEWADALVWSLQDPKSAFERAQVLRQIIIAHVDWGTSIAKVLAAIDDIGWPAP